MNKRIIALALAMTFGLALGANIASAEDGAPAAAIVAAETTEKGESAGTTETEAPEPDAEGTLSFANIESRIREKNYNVLALQEQIKELESRNYERRMDSLRDELNGIADMQWGLISNPALAGMGGIMAQSYQSLYDQTRKEFDAIKNGELQDDDAGKLRQYRNAQNLVMMMAEGYYIGLATLEERDAALTRQIAAVDRKLLTAKVSRDNGMLPELAVEQAENGRTQLSSGQQTLRMTKETTLLQLKALTGIPFDEPLLLGALPKANAAQLETMELEADLARAKEASYELYSARKQVEDLKDSYDDLIDKVGSGSSRFEVSELRAGIKAAEYSYEGTVQSYELKFRTLYAQIKDDAQKVSAAKSALALEEKNYAVSALKYKQGTISENALADAADTLADAKDSVAAAERDLFAHYRNYQWAVEYGILNS